jgi:hypothetical protein
MYLHRFYPFQHLFKRIKNLLSTRSVFNALISKSLIYFSHRVDINVAFFKKIKNKKNFRQGTKSEKKENKKIED